MTSAGDTQDDKRGSNRHAPLVWDTRTGQIDDLVNEKLESAFNTETMQSTLHDLAKIAIEHDPIDLAHAAARLPAVERPILFENLPDLNAKIIFLINTGSNTRLSIFRQLSDREIVELLEAMPPDEAVWMFEDMSDRLMKRALEKMDPKKAGRIRELYKHERNSAGRLMTNEFFAFNMNKTIGQVAAEIRANPGIALTRWIFILNEYDELIGYVPDRNLIVNPPDLPIKQVMRPIQHTVTVDTDRDEVVEMIERYEIPALPVVDEYNQLVGVISFEDAVESLKDIMDETIASMAGTAEDISEHDPIIKRFFWRAPWLVVTLLAGLITAACMTFFKTRPWFMFVPFFVPLIAGMSGNVGIQCSTLMVRSMSTGELTVGTRRKTLGKEMLMGLLIGIVFGVLCGLIVFTLNKFGFNPLGPEVNLPYAPIIVSTIVCVGLFVACMNATVLGTFSPFFFARLKIDPAVASGPIVTAFNDVTSTLMFFAVARTISFFFIG